MSVNIFTKSAIKTYIIPALIAILKSLFSLKVPCFVLSSCHALYPFLYEAAYFLQSDFDIPYINEIKQIN